MKEKKEQEETFEFKDGNNTYILNISIIDESIIINLKFKNYLLKEYESKFNLEEIKKLHKTFCFFESFKDFIDFIKKVINENKLLIKMLNEDKISLKCEIEYIAKKDNVDIILNGKPINFDLISKYMYYQFSALTFLYNIYYLLYLKKIHLE